MANPFDALKYRPAPASPSPFSGGVPGAGMRFTSAPKPVAPAKGFGQGQNVFGGKAAGGVPDRRDVADAGEIKRWITLPNGQVIPIKTPSGSQHLLRTKGSSFFFDPKDNHPYKLDARSPSGIKSAFEDVEAMPDGAGRLVKKVAGQTLDVGEDAAFVAKQAAATAKGLAAEEKKAAEAAKKAESEAKKAEAAGLRTAKAEALVTIGSAKEILAENERQLHLESTSSAKRARMIAEDLRSDGYRLDIVDRALEEASDPQIIENLKKEREGLTALMEGKRKQQETFELDAQRAALREEEYLRGQIGLESELNRKKLAVATMTNTGRLPSVESTTGINAPVATTAPAPTAKPEVPLGQAALDAGEDVSAVVRSIYAQQDSQVEAYRQWRDSVKLDGVMIDRANSPDGAFWDGKRWLDVVPGMKLDTAKEVRAVVLPKVEGMTLAGDEVKVGESRIGEVWRDEAGVPSLLMARNAPGVRSSPSLRSGNPYDGVPEYAEVSPQFIDGLQREGAFAQTGEAIPAEMTRKAQEQWAAQRWDDGQVNGLLTEWRSGNDRDRAEIVKRLQPEAAFAEPNNPQSWRLDTRKLYLGGQISLQQARLLEREFYGVQPGIKPLGKAWEEFKSGESETAQRLAGVVGNKLSSRRQIVGALEQASSAFLADYYKANGHRADFDLAEYNQLRESLAAGEAGSAWWTAQVDNALQNAVGSSAGMLVGVGKFFGTLPQAMGGPKVGMTPEEYGLVSDATLYTGAAMRRNLADRGLFTPSTWWEGKEGKAVTQSIDLLFAKIDNESLTETDFDDLAKEIARSSIQQSQRLGTPDEMQTTPEGWELAREDLLNYYDPSSPQSPLAGLLMAYQATRDPAIRAQFEQMVRSSPDEMEFQERTAAYASAEGTISENDFAGPLRLGFRGGQVAPIQESIVEILSDITTAGMGKALATGVRGAKKVQEAGKAMNIAQRAALGLSRMGERFVQMGLREGKPLQNLLVQGAKQAVTSGITEGAEEFVGAWGQTGATLKDAFVQGLQGAIGGLGLAPIMGGAGVAVDAFQQMRTQRAEMKGYADFAAQWTKDHPDDPIDAAGVKQMAGYMPPVFRAENAAAMKAAAEQMEQALVAAQQAAKDGPPSPEVMAPIEEAHAAALDTLKGHAAELRLRTVAAKEAMQEINGIADPTHRAFADAALKARMGQKLAPREVSALLNSVDETGQALAEETEGGWRFTEAGLNALAESAPMTRESFFPAEENEVTPSPERMEANGTPVSTNGTNQTTNGNTPISGQGQAEVSGVPVPVPTPDGAVGDESSPAAPTPAPSPATTAPAPAPTEEGTMHYVPVKITLPGGAVKTMDLEQMATSPEEAAQRVAQSPVMQAYQRRGATVEVGNTAPAASPAATETRTETSPQSPAPQPAANARNLPQSAAKGVETNTETALPETDLGREEPGAAIAAALASKQATQKAEVRPWRKVLEGVATMFGHKLVDTGLPFGFVDQWGKFHSFGTQLLDKMNPGSEIGQWIDKVGNAAPELAAKIGQSMTQPFFHRVWFGHDPAANVATIVDRFGWGALPEYAGQLAKDFMTKAGVPLPGTQWLVHSGIVGDETATKWLSLNVGEAFSGGLALLGSWKLMKKARNGQEIHAGWAMAGIAFKLVGGVMQSNPVLLLSGLSDAVVLTLAKPAAVKAAFEQVAERGDQAEETPETATSEPVAVPEEAKVPWAKDLDFLPAARLYPAMQALEPRLRMMAWDSALRLNATLALYAETFPAGIRFSEKREANLWVNRDGTLNINLPFYLRDTAHTTTREAIMAMVEEELAHIAAMRVMTDTEVVDLWNSLPAAMQRQVYKAYHVSDIAHKRVPSEPKGDWGSSAWNYGHEFVRMLVTDREFQGRVAEAVEVDPGFGAKIVAWLKTFIARLRKGIEALPPAQRSAVKEYEYRVRQALREMLKLPPLQKPTAEQTKSTGQRIEKLRAWMRSQPRDASVWAALTDKGDVLSIPGSAATTPWDARKQLASQARLRGQWLAWDAGLAGLNVPWEDVNEELNSWQSRSAQQLALLADPTIVENLREVDYTLSLMPLPTEEDYSDIGPPEIEEAQLQRATLPKQMELGLDPIARRRDLRGKRDLLVMRVDGMSDLVDRKVWDTPEQEAKLRKDLARYEALLAKVEGKMLADYGPGEIERKVDKPVDMQNVNPGQGSKPSPEKAGVAEGPKVDTAAAVGGRGEVRSEKSPAAEGKVPSPADAKAAAIAYQEEVLADDQATEAAKEKARKVLAKLRGEAVAETAAVPKVETVAEDFQARRQRERDENKRIIEEMKAADGNAVYPVGPEGAAFDYWLGVGIPGRPVTRWQQRLMDVVEQLLYPKTGKSDPSMFYNRTLFPAVSKVMEAELPPGMMDDSKDNGVTKEWGSHIYSAREAVDRIRAHQANLEVAKRLKPGMTLKNVKFSSHNLSTVTIGAIDEKGIVTISGKKRGSPNKWNGTVPASSLIPALNEMEKASAPAVSNDTAPALPAAVEKDDGLNIEKMAVLVAEEGTTWAMDGGLVKKAGFGHWTLAERDAMRSRFDEAGFKTSIFNNFKDSLKSTFRVSDGDNALRTLQTAIFDRDVAARNADKEAKKQEEEDRRQKELAQIDPAARQFMERHFEPEFANAYNQLQFSDFLTGKTAKFHGMISRRWLSGIQSLGIPVPEDGTVNWEMVKKRFEDFRTEELSPPAEEAPGLPPAAPVTIGQENINARPAVDWADVSTPGTMSNPNGSLRAAATQSQAPSGVWYYQGDIQQLAFNERATVNGQSGSTPYGQQVLAEAKAAKAAGWTYTNVRSSRMGTVWVFRKGDQVLTRAGAAALASGKMERPDVQPSEAGYQSMIDRFGAYSAKLVEWLQTLKPSTLDSASALSNKLGNGLISKWVRLVPNPYSTGERFSLQFLKEDGATELALFGDTVDRIVEEVARYAAAWRDRTGEGIDPLFRAISYEEQQANVWRKPSETLAALGFPPVGEEAPIAPPPSATPTTRLQDLNAPELLSPEEWLATGRSEEEHRKLIREAMGLGKRRPVNAATVAAYEMTPPALYVRKGEQLVYGPLEAKLEEQKRRQGKSKKGETSPPAEFGSGGVDAAPVKPTTAAAETPAKAEAKVEEHLQDVKATEGTRPAAEIKAELLATVTTLLKETRQRAAAETGNGNLSYEQLVKAGHGDLVDNMSFEKREFQIPGDGTFTMVLNGRNLAELLKRIKSLPVKDTGKVESSRGGAGEGTAASAKDVAAKLYTVAAVRSWVVNAINGDPFAAKVIEAYRKTDNPEGIKVDEIEAEVQALLNGEEVAPVEAPANVQGAGVKVTWNRQTLIQKGFQPLSKLTTDAALWEITKVAKDTNTAQSNIRAFRLEDGTWEAFVEPGASAGNGYVAQAILPAPAAEAAAPVAEAETVPAAPAPAPAVAGSAPAPIVDWVTTRDFLGRLNRLEVTADQIRKAFYELKANLPAVREGLAKLTKAELAKLTYRSVGGDKKESVVSSVLTNTIAAFAPGSVSYGFDKRSIEDIFLEAVEKQLDQWTEEKLDGMRAKREEAKQARIKALTNPETADEWKQFVRKQGLAELTAEEIAAFNKVNAYQLEDRIMQRGEKRLNPAQLAAYDAVRGIDRKETVEARQERAAAVDGVKVGTTSEIVETVHTKKGTPLFVVKLADRVEKDVYTTINAAAKKLGGYYSSFKGAGAVPGFQFKDRTSAEQFQAVLAGERVDRTEQVQAKKEERVNASAERLRTLADGLDAKAAEILGKDRKTNTAKRARQAAGQESDAAEMEALAKTMRNLADAMASGEAIHLDGIRAGTHVTTLKGQARAAKDRAEQAEGLSYADREKRKYEPPTPDQMSAAKYPFPYVDKSSMAEMVEKGLKTPGAKLLAARVAKIRMNEVDGSGVTLRSADDIDNVKKLSKMVSGYRRTIWDMISWHFDAYDRLQAMGLTDLVMLRAALREFTEFQGTRAAPDPLKALERDLVGMKLPGFFPTPRALIDQMIEQAGDLTGKRVLEPSAGKGDIVQAAQEAGGTVDALEISSTLRKLLEARGVNLIGQDFMTEEVNPIYDVVLMNPPFEDGQDMAHVQRAYEFLKPGGKLVAIVSAGPFYRQDKKAVAFREWLDGLDGVHEPLPEGAFAGNDAFRQTGVRTEMITLEKAEEAPAVEAGAPVAAAETQKPTALRTQAEVTAPVKEVLEVGDEVTWQAAGREAQGTIARIQDGKAGIDYFGYKLVPLEELTLKRKSNARVARELQETSNSERKALEKEMAKSEPVKQRSPINEKAAKAQKKYLLDEIQTALGEAPARQDLTEEQRTALNDLEWAGRAVNSDGTRDQDHPEALADYRKARAKVAEMVGYVDIEVPGDGTFSIINEKTALQLFAKRAAKFPVAVRELAAARASNPEATAIPPLKKPKTTADVVAALYAFTSGSELSSEVMRRVWGDGENLVATNGRFMAVVTHENGGAKGSETLYSEKGAASPVPEGEKVPAWQMVMPVPRAENGKWRNELTLDTGRWFAILAQIQAIHKNQEDQTKLPTARVYLNSDTKLPTARVYLNSDGSLGMDSLAADGNAYAHNVMPGAQVLGGYNPSYLQAILKAARALGHETVQMNTEDVDSPALFEAGKAKFVLMPMRVNGGAERAPILSPDPNRPLATAMKSAPIDVDAQAAATSVENALPQPTAAQKEAGNYAKGHTRIGGLEISIENPVGSVRRGTNANGKAWETTMQAHYGYVRGTEGPDGDHLDVFIAPGTPAEFRGTVYVVEQTTADGKAFDEHKAVFGQGIDSPEAAGDLYHANYEPGWQGGHAIQAMPWEQFKVWAQSSLAALPLEGRTLATGNRRAGIRAYHGTPHKVDKFTVEKIGTGEGAQAFGWGLYFAQEKQVAEGYQSRIAGAQWVDKSGRQRTAIEIGEAIYDQARKDGYSVKDADELRSYWSVYAQNGGMQNTQGIESIRAVVDGQGIKLKRSGNLYTVELLPNEDEFLDWDKPLSEQSEKVRKAVGPLIHSRDTVKEREVAFAEYDAGTISKLELSKRLEEIPTRSIQQSDTGAAIYQRLWSSQTTNGREASEFLASIGIPGIRYLDGNSRDGGSGTSNYVIFDDSQVQIIEENGRALEPEAQQWADQVIAESRQQVAMGMDPRLLVAYAIKGARVLADGMKTLATWSAEMAKRFGDKVQPYLKSIWAALSGTQSSNDALSTSNRRAPAASYDAAKAEGEARAKKAAAVKRSSVLTQVAGQRVLFKRDARSFWADVVSGNIDRIDYYAPGFRNIWLDTEREMALARAAVNSLFETLNSRARRGFGYPAWWKSKAVRAKWQEFQNVMLPTAARLEASGVNERGEFEFKDFMMRAGRVPVEVAEKAGLGVGDVMNVDGEALTLGPSFSVRESNATTGKGKLVSYHLLLRPVSAADQQATYRAFVDEWAAFPVAKELLDEFIMPGLDKGRFIGPRQFRTAEFNRYSLRDVYNEWPDALREQFGALPELEFSDGYVPDVPIKSGISAIAGGVFAELLRSYQSPARRFAKQGLRESGDVKNLFEGFQTQLMQAHMEKVRMERRGRLLKAAAVPEAQIPVADRHLWMPVNDAFEMVYEAVVLARNLDRGAFPALTGALNPEQVDLMRSIVGEAWMLRGRAMQIPAAIYNEMLAEVATAQTENLLLKLALWFMQQLNAASLASFQYLGMNFIGNEILKVAFAVQSGYKAMLFAMSGRMEDKARARLALSTARYLMQGAILDRFPLRRERFREILPREIFDTNHFYNALQGMDEGVLDNVKKLQFGSAFLAAVRAGNWDVGAKVQLANAMYQAYAREAWRDAAKRDVSLTRLSKEKKRQWLKDYVATAPATVHREVEMAAGEWLMNYENTPRWMNSGAIKPFIDPTKPGKMSQAVMAAQMKKLAIAAFIPFLRWSYLFVRKVKRTAIDEGVRNIVGATGNTREGIANLMALGTLVAAPAMLTFLKEPGGDDDAWDKVEAQLLGRSRDMEGKDLDRTLKATNRFNVSALARIAYAKLGFMEDYNGEAFTVTDNAGQKADVWLRYRNYPFIKEGIVLGLWLQALRGSQAPVVDDRIKRSTGNAAGNITAKDAFGQSWQALTGEYVSLGLGYTMLESVLAGAMSGSQSADAMNDLRNSTVDLLTSPVLPHRLMRDIGVLVDPTDRRSRPSARLGYDPGWLETFMARIPGLKSKLPLDGEVAAPTILSAKSSVPPAEQAELLKHFDIPATAVTYSKDRPSRDAFLDLRMLKDLGAGPQDVGLSMSKTTKSAPKPLVAFPKPDQVRQRNRWIEALRMTSPINTLPVNQTAYRAAVTATEKKD